VIHRTLETQGPLDLEVIIQLAEGERELKLPRPDGA
jgi:hypothetical protein